jgi:hypothetical protein
MNERIEQLAEQAGFQRTKFGLVATPESNAKMFAELIVRECANRASWAQDTNEADIGGEVLKHFGVEE